jgi:hypothetical protein
VLELVQVLIYVLLLLLFLSLSTQMCCLLRGELLKGRGLQ